MEQSNLFNNTQFGFRPNDSCIYQLISATDCICCIFDTNLSLKLSGVFLHLIKSGMAVSFTNFKIMEQTVIFFVSSNLFYIKGVLNGHSLIWKIIIAGAPQGSLHVPLFFLVYISDLPQGLAYDVKLLADDTSLFSFVNRVITFASIVHNDLTVIQGLAYQWKISFNPDKKP